MYQVHKKSKLIYRKTCERCHSNFSFDDEEIIHTYKGSNPIDKFTHVECPVCGTLLEVEASDFSDFQESAPENIGIFKTLGDLVENFFSNLPISDEDEEDEEE